MKAYKLDIMLAELRFANNIRPYDKVELVIQDKESAECAYYYPEKIEKYNGNTIIHFGENDNNFLNFINLRCLASNLNNKDEIIFSVNNRSYEIAYVYYSEVYETLVLHT